MKHEEGKPTKIETIDCSVDVVMETSMGEMGLGDQMVVDETMQARLKSFKEACMRQYLEDEEGLEEVDYVSDDDAINKDEEEEDCPTIVLAKEVKARLRKPWRLTLIIKVLGCIVGYNYFLMRIRSMWKPKAPMELVAIENDFFLFNSISWMIISLQSMRGVGWS